MGKIPSMLMWSRAILCGVLIVALGRAGESGGRTAASVKLTPEDGHAIVEAAPVTFGLVFKPGEVPKGKTVEARAAGRPVPAQVDVKRRHDDGSLRYAIVSAVLAQSDAAGETWDFAVVDALPPAPPNDAATESLFSTGFDADVTLTFPDGKRVSAGARSMLAAAAGKAVQWLSGATANEWLLMGPPRDAEGKADPDLNVQFQVRAYQGCASIRVSVVVENCWDFWAGTIGYDAAVKSGEDVVFERKGVEHERLSRWRRVFWWPGPPPAVHVAHDPAQLTASRALPNYDLGLDVPEKALAEIAARWSQCRDELLGNGFLCKYMPTTGGREEIGPYPRWTVCYLLSMDSRAKRAVLGNGDLAGSWPIHVRNSRTGRLMTIDERPRFWLDERGEDRPNFRPDRKPRAGKGLELSPDVAHQGSFAYVPYLVTGDYYYLEEAAFWANYCLISQWPHPREGGRGIMSDQIRGNAWGLRNIADAGYIAPDGSPEAKYFEDKIRNNIAAMLGAMYGPPEKSVRGFWGERTTDDARIQNPANPKWLIVVPWENDYLTWSLHHLVELGYADAARARDYELRWRVGVFTHPDDYDPRLGAAYRMVAGERGPDGKAVFYDDWKKLGAENLRLNKPELSKDYALSARAVLTCAIDAGFPKAGEALGVLEGLMPNALTHLDETPLWAIVPRGTR